MPGSASADVAIVGAGYTGLWTAYYLLGADPSLRVALVEQEIAGFGASGRNGGWCSALFPVSASRLASEHGRDAAVAQYRAMRDSVAEVVRVAAAERIEADAALAAESARRRLAATSVVGGTYAPHCAAIHPAKLARGLADAVEARGASIYEQTRASAIEPGVVHTERGTLRADVVVRATEGYTPRLAGQRRAIAPVYSLIIATEPLPQAAWDEIGLAQRETFADYRHLIIYGQRTADGRMVFGGRGAPYHFGSRIDASYDRVPAVFAALQRTLGELFPVLRDAAITHRWGGPLGVARDWHASVGLDRITGLAWAGGYVGDGVSTTNLAGRTLADLILRNDSPLADLPWVGHQSPRWEPEPLRWLGANAGLRAMTWADAAEARNGRSSRLAGAVNRLLGR